MVIHAAPQVSLAVGVSQVRLPTPHSLVLLPEQEMLGTVVSTVAIVWLHLLVLPHWSVATQVRVATKVLPQVRLVTVLRMLIEDGKSVVQGKSVDLGGRRIIKK